MKKTALQASQEFGISFSKLCNIIDCDKDFFTDAKNFSISYESYRRLLLFLKFRDLIMVKFNNDTKKIYNWMNKPIKFNKGSFKKKPKNLIENEFIMNRIISLLEDDIKQNSNLNNSKSLWNF